MICCRPVPSHFSHWGWVAMLEIFPARWFQHRDFPGADLVVLGELDRLLGLDGAFGAPVFGYLVFDDGFVVLVHDSSSTVVGDSRSLTTTTHGKRINDKPPRGIGCRF